VVRPTLGLTYANAGVTQSLRVSEGALVQTVDSNGAAAQAGVLGTRRGLGGIIAGDVIVAVNGKRVKYPSDVDVGLDTAHVGDTIALTLRRGVDQPVRRCLPVPGAQPFGLWLSSSASAEARGPDGASEA